tara:strand:+ start:269 stop:406 length:138 start_codon:yes stop_codon:yes gene_type:complete
LVKQLGRYGSMVEQWIVGPKVAGSNPSIYPFMQIEQKSLPLIKND